MIIKRSVASKIALLVLLLIMIVTLSANRSDISAKGVTNDIPSLSFADGTRFYIEDGCLLGVSSGKTVLSLLTEVTASNGLAIKDSLGNTFAGSSERQVVTGDLLCCGDVSYNIVVIADTDRDGAITVNDYLMIKRYFKFDEEISVASFMAADVNNDGRLSVWDYIAIKRSLAGQFDLLRYYPKVNGLCIGAFDPDAVPEFSGSPYVALNCNEPYYEEEQLVPTAFEEYGEKDSLGRCTYAFSCVCTELMSNEPRGDISSVTPSGWHSVKYDIVPGKYLYNRCHLIGYQLTGENDNDRNLITGTRYLNITGMLPFENMIADYVKETENHVLYRVTPIFFEDDLVAKGLIMEAYSIEDDGEGICFCVFAYNSQPGITIDYATGDSMLSDPEQTTETTSETTVIYVINTNSKKFHLETCRYASTIKEEYKLISTKTAEELQQLGYVPCSVCMH